MTVTAIITFTSQPGQREAMAEVMHEISARLPDIDGFVGIQSFNAVDDPDAIIEFVEWDSVAAHGAFRELAKSSGWFDDLGAVTTGPPAAIYVEAR